MRLLYLQNGPARTTVSGLERRFADAGFDVTMTWAYGGEDPGELGAYDACFVSGSPHGAYEDIPWIHREHAWLQDLARRGVPMLGICFGSQILASALCGRDQVFRRKTCEVGYMDLAVTAAARQDPVAGDLGDTVHMFVWHNDEVKAAHPDMVIFATSPDCPNHVWRHARHPAWGIQGHPEVSAEQARGWFESSRARLEADGADVPALQRAARDAVEADTMLVNFMTAARQGALKAA
ncbi:type 1 glutamine amidotransferase [uncultured Alsobacter sp.]|uniref:type 1 glutamine amidotransferase n=1 Tax=uncultured Alsobacter sp. TaxID=1748258 RepID=UPI0025DC9F0B|nr:type 1 glutamine amidotransferase [uncultured Alsobacter sp.]